MNAKANNTIDKVRQLQRKLYLSAKSNKKRRFHAMYDKVYRKDILYKAWLLVKQNKGVAGVDNVFIKDIIDYGEDKFLKELQTELMENKYIPLPVKRVYIPKKDGRKRPLGIPIIKDRVVQMATKIVIEPIFEANFKECSYGFRPKRSSLHAIDKINQCCKSNGYKVLDADIKSYFDNISHDKLMILVEQRISDRRILKLIRKWLNAGVIENGNNIKSTIGSPQGGVISPLLSNIYLNYFDTIWERYYFKLGTLVRYADDFVIICKNWTDVKIAKAIVTKIMEKLELTIHPEKTRIIDLWDGKEGFDFLGFHNKKIKQKTKDCRSVLVITNYPSNKSMKSMKEKIKQTLLKSTCNDDIPNRIKVLNRKLSDFKNYYGNRYAYKWLAKIDWYVTIRFNIWINNKRRKRNKFSGMEQTRQLIDKLGIVRLAT
ncbi:group II intron reverse transcriptase/maturase [Clostridium lundense]|uniref:group II intron reverse transcriptase/maturase n=1 Tax=Clostridium lundense TaxID=319475 RepID=UPI00048A3017|nr:group II intron reverse transcriptase/maturase [Clostridium lundense]